MFHLSRFIVALVTLAALLLVAPLALAADGGLGGDAGALAEFSAAALDVLMPAIIVLLGWLANKIVKIFESKTSIDVPKEQEAQIDRWIAQGARYAEKRARTAIKHELTPIKGPEKVEVALGYVLDLAYERGWTNWSRKRLEAKLEAFLDEYDERSKAEGSA